MAALTVSGARAARTRMGVGRGNTASPDPPREQDGSEGEAAAAAHGSSSCRVSVREEARHLPRLWRRGWPWGPPQDGPGDQAPGQRARARARALATAGVPGVQLGLGLRDVCAGPGASAPDGQGEREWPGAWLAFAPRTEGVMSSFAWTLRNSEPLWTGFKPQQGVCG